MAESGIGRCVVLAGGTGGAKLAAGIQDVLGEGLSVIANTADDIEIAAVDVSPDPDLITYWLSGEIDEERGWGIKDDSFVVFDRLVKLGTPDWFRLSDRDLATCLYRKEFIAEGGRRTDAQAQITRALGLRAAVLPMCEEPVRTQVRTAEGWRGLQQYLVAEHAEAPVEEVRVEGIGEATPTPEILEAIVGADAIAIGPSNPVISIGPILAVRGVRDALESRRARVIAISPIVGGAPVKGPADRLMGPLGIEVSCVGIAREYAPFCGALVIDAIDAHRAPEVEAAGVRAIVTDTMMRSPEIATELARRTLAAVA